MTRYRQELGNLGETQAINYLINLGYVIVARNYRTPYGEIDLIMTKDDILVFVEVKTRKSASMGFPEISVNRKKLEHFRQSAHHYLSLNDCLDKNIRLDVISIQFLPGQPNPQIFHFENIQT